MSVRVFLIGQGLFRDSLRSLLQGLPGVTIVGESPDGKELVHAHATAATDWIIADGDVPLSPFRLPLPHLFISLRHNTLIAYTPQAFPATPLGLAQALGVQEQPS